MVKAVFAIVLLGLVAVQSVYSAELKCYICDKCDTVKDDQLKACTKEDPTTVKPNPTTVKTDPPTTVKTDPPTTAKTYKLNSFNVRNRRNIEDRADSTEATSAFKCFTMTYKDGEDTVTKRGCTLQNCEKIKTDSKDKKEVTCKDCNEEGCNPAANIKSWTLSSVILLAIIKMFL